MDVDGGGRGGQDRGAGAGCFLRLRKNMVSEVCRIVVFRVKWWKSSEILFLVVLIIGQNVPSCNIFIRVLETYYPLPYP